MKITKHIIDRSEALRLAPDYVAAIEGNLDAMFDRVMPVFEKLKLKQQVISFVDGVFVKATVTSIRHNDPRAIDGPVVRVSNGEISWRVDGNKFAYPI